MKRKTEKRLITTAAIWHFINAILTIFVFGMWFRSNGDVAIMQMYPELAGGSSSFVDIIYTVLTTYSVLIILVGIANLYCLKFLKDDEINKKWQAWLIILVILSLLSVDVISSLIYLITIVTYSSKNKAIRIKHETNYQLANNGGI